MAQSSSGISILSNLVGVGDNASRDAFGRLRTSQAIALFDSQFTNDLQPLLFGSNTSGSGASVAFDSTNRNALCTFSSTATGGTAYLQSFEFFRYTAGRSQRILITFNFLAQVANCLKFAGYSDGTNGMEFQNNGTANQFVIYSGTSTGNQTVTQANWNLDKFDGTGPSGLTLDISKAQILVIDFQALYTGRVRMGFDIAGSVVYAHQFLASNVFAFPYIQTANLPIRCGMTCTGTVSATMRFTCCTVQNEGIVQKEQGYNFSQESSLTASSGALTHALSLRPAATFNSIVNRNKINIESLNIVVTGNSPILYQLVIGQAISGTTSFTAVNSTYSVSEYNSAGTISGNATIVLYQGYVAAANSNPGQLSQLVTSKIPLTLDAAGAARALGTLSVLVLGVGGVSACRVSLNWQEVR